MRFTVDPTRETAVDYLAELPPVIAAEPPSVLYYVANRNSGTSGPIAERLVGHHVVSVVNGVARIRGRTLPSDSEEIELSTGGEGDWSYSWAIADGWQPGHEPEPKRSLRLCELDRRNGWSSRLVTLTTRAIVPSTLDRYDGTRGPTLPEGPEYSADVPHVTGSASELSSLLVRFRSETPAPGRGVLEASGFEDAWRVANLHPLDSWHSLF